MAVEEAVVERPIEQVECQLDVGTGWKLAAFDRAQEDRAGLCAARFDETFAVTAYPGGIVDRVVKLSDGEYEVHNIGVNWPHHIFVGKYFEVVGAG